MSDDPHYGDGTAAGFKGRSKAARENSREAAAAVTETLPRRHQQMVDAWSDFGRMGAIPEQVADNIDLPVHVIRPRCGELVKKGRFHEVGKRPGLMGKPVMAYSVFPPDGEAA